MFIDFVTYLEIRDDLSEEDAHFINSEIERYMKKCDIQREGIKYYAETWPGRGLHLLKSLSLIIRVFGRMR